MDAKDCERSPKVREAEELFSVALTKMPPMPTLQYAGRASPSGKQELKLAGDWEELSASKSAPAAVRTFPAEICSKGSAGAAPKVLKTGGKTRSRTDGPQLNNFDRQRLLGQRIAKESEKLGQDFEKRMALAQKEQLLGPMKKSGRGKSDTKKTGAAESAGASSKTAAGKGAAPGVKKVQSSTD